MEEGDETVSRNQTTESRETKRHGQEYDITLPFSLDIQES
jgi:hypothetical protein